MDDEVAIQVYRKRGGGAEGWDYLGTVPPAVQVSEKELRARPGLQMEALVPFVEIQKTWGGGDYQCRFMIGRGRKGRRIVRSRNVSIFGRPLPR